MSGYEYILIILDTLITAISVIPLGDNFRARALEIGRFDLKISKILGYNFNFKKIMTYDTEMA